MEYLKLGFRRTRKAPGLIENAPLKIYTGPYPHFQYNMLGALIDYLRLQEEKVENLRYTILFIKNAEKIKQLKLKLNYLLAFHRFDYSQRLDDETNQRILVVKALTWLYDKTIVDFSVGDKIEQQQNQQKQYPFHYFILKKIVTIIIDLLKACTFKIEKLMGAHWPVDDWYLYIENYIFHKLYNEKLIQYDLKLDETTEQLVPKKRQFKEYDAEQRKTLLLNYRRFELYIDSLQLHVDNLVKGRVFDDNKKFSFYKFWSKKHKAYLYENKYQIYRYQNRRVKWIHDIKVHKWVKAKKVFKFVWQILVNLPKRFFDWLTMSIWYMKNWNFWFSYTRYTALKQMHSLYFYKSSYFVWTHLENIQIQIKPTQHLKDMMQPSLDKLLKYYWPYLDVYNMEMVETLIAERIEFVKTRWLVLMIQWKEGWM